MINKFYAVLRLLYGVGFKRLMLATRRLFGVQLEQGRSMLENIWQFPTDNKNEAAVNNTNLGEENG